MNSRHVLKKEGDTVVKKLKFKDFVRILDTHKTETSIDARHSTDVRSVLKALAGHYDFQDRRVLTDLRARKRINPKNNTVETVIENSVSYSHSLIRRMVLLSDLSILENLVCLVKIRFASDTLLKNNMINPQ